MKELSLHILDIAENSIDAGASKIIISIKEDAEQKLLCIEIDDNGKGMSQQMLDLTADPFFTSRITRKQGLGIPLFRQHAEMTGGKLEIQSKEGEGTQLKAEFYLNHPDIQPLGDVESVWILLAVLHPDIEMILKCSASNGEFEISTEEIKQTLEIDKIEGKELSDQLKILIRNKLDDIGLLHEIID